MSTDFTADDDTVQLTRYASGMNGHRYQITSLDGFCTITNIELLRLVIGAVKALTEDFDRAGINISEIAARGFKNEKTQIPTYALVRVQGVGIDETRTIEFGTTQKMGDYIIVTVQYMPLP